MQDRLTNIVQVVTSVADIIDTCFNKEIALAIADMLGQFTGFKIEPNWAVCYFN